MAESYLGSYPQGPQDLSAITSQISSLQSTISSLTTRISHLESGSGSASSSWKHMSTSIGYGRNWSTLISSCKVAIIQIDSTITHREGAQYGPPYPVILLSSSDSSTYTAKYGHNLSNGQMEFEDLDARFRISESALMYYVPERYNSFSLSILYQ